MAVEAFKYLPDEAEDETIISRYPGHSGKLWYYQALMTIRK